MNRLGGGSTTKYLPQMKQTRSKPIINYVKMCSWQRRRVYGPQVSNHARETLCDKERANNNKKSTIQRNIQTNAFDYRKYPKNNNENNWINKRPTSTQVLQFWVLVILAIGKLSDIFCVLFILVIKGFQQLSLSPFTNKVLPAIKGSISNVLCWQE